MPFEINLPCRIDVWTLRCAGMETDEYHQRSMDVTIKDAPLPFEVKLPYFLSDPPATISVTMLKSGKTVRLRIAAPDKAIERAIRKHMKRYSAENDGERVSDREHQAVWKQIETVLNRGGLSYDKLSAGDALPTRPVIEALINLAAKIDRTQLNNISDLFANGPVAKADQEFAARWLIKLFTDTPDPFERDQLGLRIWENAVPAVGDELVALIENRKYGSSRSGLLMGLVKIKHPRAADVIASVLHEKHMAWAGLQALAKLKATQHIDKIRRCLRDPDSDVRREAKKALKKLGAPVDVAPPPVHLVKAKGKLPRGLEEWSRNLDMDQVEPILKKLAKCLSSGFGAAEVAEVIGVVEEMRHDQTKAFRFPVKEGKKPGELWLVIFMDDIDSPDLEVHADPAIIRRFSRLVPLDA